MDIRCRNCGKLLFRAIEDTEVVGTIMIKCKCGFLNEIKGKLAQMGRLAKSLDK